MALYSPGSSHDALLTLPQVGNSRLTDRSATSFSNSSSPLGSRRPAATSDAARHNFSSRPYSNGSTDAYANSQRLPSPTTRRAHSNGATRPHTVQPDRRSRSSRPPSQPRHSTQQGPPRLGSTRTQRPRTSTPLLPPRRDHGASRSARGHSSRTRHGSPRERPRQSSAPRANARSSPSASPRPRSEPPRPRSEPPRPRSEPPRPASSSRAASPSTTGTTTTATLGTASGSGSSSARARLSLPLYHPAALNAAAVGTPGAGAAAAHGLSSSGYANAAMAVVPSPLRDHPPADAPAPLPRHVTAAHGAPPTSAAGANSALTIATASGAATAPRSVAPGKGASSAALARRSTCYCSHCKLAEEVLYGCPCGLARYCSTTCQRAHWPVHKTVCSCAVRAVRPPTRRCDWCRTSSQTLRQCGCGFAYYCDTQCQREDWPNHCITCSTVTSQALATALVGRDAPLRGRREAATQTAHWQISVPVVDDSSWASPMQHGSPHDRHSRSVSGEELMSFSGLPSESSLMAAGDAAAISTSVSRTHASSRHRSRHRASSEYESQLGATSSSYTFHQGRGGGHGASGHYADPGGRTPLSTYVAPEGSSLGGDASALHHGVSSVRAVSRGRRSRHHANGSSLYNGLYMNGTASHHSSHINPTFENSAFAASQSLRLSQAPLGHTGGGAGASMSSHRHHHSFQMDSHGAGTYSGDGDFGERPGASMSTPTVRDQPGMMAFLVASRNIIERDEVKARAALSSAFGQAGVQLQMGLLNRREEEERMAILREELRWFVLTGQPGWRTLRKELQAFLQSRK